MFFKILQSIETQHGQTLLPGISLQCLNMEYGISQLAHRFVPHIQTHMGEIDIRNITTSTAEFTPKRRVLFVKKHGSYHAVLTSGFANIGEPEEYLLYRFYYNKSSRSLTRICPIAFTPDLFAISQIWGCTRNQIMQDIMKIFTMNALIPNVANLKNHWNWTWFKSRKDFDLWTYDPVTQKFEFDCNLLDIITKLIASYHAIIHDVHYSIKSVAQKFVLYNVNQDIGSFYFYRNTLFDTKSYNNSSIEKLIELEQDIEILYRYFSSRGGIFRQINSAFLLAYTNGQTQDLPKLTQSSSWVIWKIDYPVALAETQETIRQTINI